MEGNRPVKLLDLLWRLKPFSSLAGPYFHANRSASIQVAILIALTLLTQVIYVIFSYIQRNIFNSLVDKDANQFYLNIVQYVAILIIAIPTAVAKNVVSRRLALDWRQAMTADFIQKYYAKRCYYELELTKAAHGIDNPDQRICNDIADFTASSLKFFFILLEAVINLVLFSYVLFQIFPLLYLVVLLYSIVGSVAIMVIGKTLPNQYYSQIQKEADFRFGVIGTRDNAEAIAFYDANALFERSQVWQLFTLVYRIQSQIIFTQLRIESFSKFYEYAAYVVPYLIMAPSYFAGSIDVGSIMQSNDAFFNIRSDFSVLISNYEDLSLYVAGMDRLSELQVALDQSDTISPSKYEDNSSSGNRYTRLSTTDPKSSSSGEGSISSPLLDADSNERISALTRPVKQIIYNFASSTITTDKNIVLLCQNLRIYTPDGKALGISTDDRSCTVSLQVALGDRILITGPSGIGKSSLLRALAGLWMSGTGSVTWYLESCHGLLSNNAIAFSASDVIFLPQSTYVGRGTLRQLIKYPFAAKPSAGAGEIELEESHLWSELTLRSAPQRAPPVASFSMQSRGFQEDQAMLQILGKVDLLHVARSMGSGNESLGLDVMSDLSKTLSAGEKQRLAFARVLYHRPRVVFLDESTSALDAACEQRLYEELRSLGVAFVSVGHRESLLAYHDRVIALQNAPTTNNRF